MAWQDLMPIMVRSLMGDNLTVETFTDDDLNEMVAVAAIIVSSEFPFTTTYTIDLSLPEISPDFTVSPNLDQSAMALFGLKAACMILTNNFSNALGSAIQVADGTSKVSTVGGLRGYADILKAGPCASYASLYKILLARQSANIGRAVVSPFSTGLAPWGSNSPAGVFQARGFFDFFLRY